MYDLSYCDRLVPAYEGREPTECLQLFAARKRSYLLAFLRAIESALATLVCHPWLAFLLLLFAFLAGWMLVSPADRKQHEVRLQQLTRRERTPAQTKTSDR